MQGDKLWDKNIKRGHPTVTIGETGMAKTTTPFQLMLLDP